MEMQIRDEVCSLPLIYFRTDPKSISSVSNGGVDLGLFFVWRLLLEIWASSAHHQMIFSAIRSTCAEISWGYCWLESHVSYPHHFFFVL